MKNTVISSYSLIHQCKFCFLVNCLINTGSAHDDGIYCVDVGVVNYKSVPNDKPMGRWVCLGNADLITFAEVKKLVVCPMLLAQFLGIVHEIRPEFLKSGGKANGSNLPPVLIALSHFSGNAAAIVKAYPARGINVTIAENYDVRLAEVRGGRGG